MTSGLWAITLFLCAAAAVLGLMMRSSSTGPRRLREGVVTLIVGRKGHGKSLYAVHEMLRTVGTRCWCRECETHHPVTIASNVTLRLPPSVPFVHVGEWSDIVAEFEDDDGVRRNLCLLPHCTLLVLDEVHLGFAPATQGVQLPRAVRWFLAQVRKLHVEVIGISQHEDRVSLGFRRQTDEVGVCQRGMFRRMRVRLYEPELVGKARTGPARGANAVRPNWVFHYRVTRKLSRAYDTYELLDGADEFDRAPSLGRASGRGRSLASASVDSGTPTVDDD